MPPTRHSPHSVKFDQLALLVVTSQLRLRESELTNWTRKLHHSPQGSRRRGRCSDDESQSSGASGLEFEYKRQLFVPADSYGIALRRERYSVELKMPS